jgi:hypothetical protein
MQTYSFHGFVAREATLRAAAGGIPLARFEKLRFGLAFLPLDEDLLAALGDPEPVSNELERLSTGAANLGAEASRLGAVAYVEAEVEAGSGYHAGIAWHAGAVTRGPLRLEDRSPVNLALAELGIENAAGADELGTLRLDDRSPG